MCDCFKELINKGLGRDSNDYIVREEKKAIKKQKKAAKTLGETAHLVVANQTFVTYNGETIDMSQYSAKKRQGVQSMINHNCFKTKDKLLKHISLLNKN